MISHMTYLCLNIISCEHVSHSTECWSYKTLVISHQKLHHAWTQTTINDLLYLRIWSIHYNIIERLLKTEKKEGREREGARERRRERRETERGREEEGEGRERKGERGNKRKERGRGEGKERGSVHELEREH